jgi:putative Mg2+ transporter-C (MgtC) family protein
MPEIYNEDTLKLILSLLMGSLIGLEREYRSKAAGFRTITLIGLGSTLFTIVSVKLGGVNNADRIAANIITGIGFLGAGVVFRDAFTITGLTTATSIWVTAALGMAIGSGDYVLAAEGLVLVIVVLSLFEIVQGWVDNFHQKRSYKIFINKNIELLNEIDITLKELNLKLAKIKELKLNDERVLYYDVSGSRKNIDKFNSFLLDLPTIKSFE